MKSPVQKTKVTKAGSSKKIVKIIEKSTFILYN